MKHLLFSKLHNQTSAQLSYATLFCLKWFLIHIFVDSLINEIVVGNKNKLFPQMRRFQVIKSDAEAKDIKNRLVAILHGFVSFWLALYTYFSTKQSYQPNTNLQVCVLLFSITYFTYHLVACVYSQMAHKWLIIHHVISAFSFVLALFYGEGAQGCIGTLFMGEISNIWMHGRSLLKIFDKKHTKLYQFFENMFFSLYIFFRAIVFPAWILFPSIIKGKNPFFIHFMGLMFLAKSLYYVSQMRGIIVGKIAKYKQKQQKNISYKWFDEDKKQLERLSFYKKKDSDKIF